MAMPSSAPFIAAAMCTVGVIGGAYSVYQFYKEKRKNTLPEEWIHVGYLKQLFAYPVKSCAGITLDQAECSLLGLKNGYIRDRTLSVVIEDKEEYAVVRFKSLPEMLKIKSNINDTILTLEHPKMEPVSINLEKIVLEGKILQASINSASVPAYDCGDEVNEWITKCLDVEDTAFRLVYYGSENCRDIAGYLKRWPKIFNTLKTIDTGAFADEITYHVINEASIDDLNSRLDGVKVDEARFRPNLLLAGCKPFDEDKWKYVKIGQNIFQVIKPCMRCIAITIDPETGDRDKNMEPLVTLRSYRLATDPAVLKFIGNLPLMGIHMALRSGHGGTLSVNEPVYVCY